MTVTARHEAVLDDGRRVLLLADRGWSAQLDPASTESIWSYETIQQLEQTARDVVGPDEPLTGSTQAAMKASHWTALAGTLHEQGVEVLAAELSELPHDVELSSRLRKRLPRPPGEPC